MKLLIFLPILFAFAPLTAFAEQHTATVGDSLSLENFMQKNNIKAEKMRDGLFCTTITEGSGEALRQGEYVKIRYVGKLLNGKTFDESPVGEPFVFQIGYRQVVTAWDMALVRLKIGAKVKLYVAPQLAYGTSGIGDVIPANAPLIYEIELLEKLNHAQYDAHMRALEDKERAAFDERMKGQFETDKQIINDYALMHRLKVNRSSTGLSYIVTKQGTGELPKIGSQLTVHYEGMLVNDKIFDSTTNREPFSFTLGEGRTIAGWEEGLRYFAKGTEGFLLIPSKLGYGATPLDDGKILIPSNSVLIFKIQMIDVK